jgi:hypothetical protein
MGERHLAWLAGGLDDIFSESQHGLYNSAK